MKILVNKCTDSQLFKYFLVEYDSDVNWISTNMNIEEQYANLISCKEFFFFFLNNKMIEMPSQCCQ